MRHQAAFAASALLAALFTTPADAAGRLWVASFGNDASATCNFTAPCLTFSRAVTLASAESEISCIDAVPGAGMFINKSITINCEGMLAGNGVRTDRNAVGVVTISTSATDVVVLRGLQLNFQNIDGGIISEAPERWCSTG